VGLRQARHARADMGMGNGKPQGVSGVLARHPWQFQEPLDHFLHFGLSGFAIARHSLLHLQRGVFRHSQVSLATRAVRQAPRA
jgi:hypothetical protein